MLTRNLFGPQDFPLAASLAVHRTGIDLHRHDSVELALVTQGHATHRLETEAYAIEAGDAFVILPNVLHGYENCRGFSVMNLGFDPERLTLPTHQLAALPGYRALFMLEPQVRTKHAFRSRLQLERSALDRVLAIVASLQRELQERAPGFALSATSYFTAVLVELARQYERMRSPASQSLVRLSAVVEWLADHFTEPITLEEIARAGGMSKSSLRRSFQECFGLSPMNYVIDLRLRQAEFLLRDTQTPIRDIAALVGVDDASYFSRLFRRRSGLEPSAYRATHRGD